MLYKQHLLTQTTTKEGYVENAAGGKFTSRY